jgi:hypothetical protein
MKSLIYLAQQNTLQAQTGQSICIQPLQAVFVCVAAVDAVHVPFFSFPEKTRDTRLG